MTQGQVGFLLHPSQPGQETGGPRGGRRRVRRDGIRREAESRTDRCRVFGGGWVRLVGSCSYLGHEAVQLQLVLSEALIEGTQLGQGVAQ